MNEVEYNKNIPIGQSNLITPVGPSIRRSELPLISLLKSEPTMKSPKILQPARSFEEANGPHCPKNIDLKFGANL